MDKKATLTLHDGRKLEFPVLSGTIGPDVVDIRTLYGKSGVFTYDPGFLSTASCSSNITYIDGDAGGLLYCGYPVQQRGPAVTGPSMLPPPSGARFATLLFSIFPSGVGGNLFARNAVCE